MIIFRITFFLVLFSSSYLIYKKNIAPLKIPTIIKAPLLLIFVVSIFTYPIVTFFDINIPSLLLTYCTTMTNLYLGYLSFWVLIAIASWITVRLGKSYGVIKDVGYRCSRRDFIKQVGLVGMLAAPAIPVLKGVTNAYSPPKVVIVPINETPFKRLRIVQISDLHIGSTLDGDWLKDLVVQVNDLSPDIIAITGDLIDGSVDFIRSDIAHLAALKAKSGVYMVTGNHEFYSGIDEWVEHFTTLGLHVLNNEHRVIKHENKTLLLAGMWDHEAGKRFGDSYKENAIEALGEATGFDYAVMLAHQPNAIHETNKVGCFDLQLSGHTHAGQFWPFTEAINLFQIYVSGMYELTPTKLYVNIGTGFWGPPLRLDSENEITVIELS